MHVSTWSTSGSSAPLRGRSTRGVSALGRGESTFGSIAPGCGTDFSSLYRGEIFCARARRIHLRIYRARARNWFFFSIKRRKFSALGRGESTFGSIAPGRGTDFLFYIEEKIFCARARRIHLQIYRARARNRFSSLYRGENFLRSGAENPPLDLLRPDAERIFLLYIEEKIFCARGRGIHFWIYRARARNKFSSLYKGENFLRPGAENPRFFSIWRRK